MNNIYIIEIEKQTRDVADAMNKIYRCLVPKLPRAWNENFEKNKDGTFEFKDWFQDEQRPEKESGYVTGGKGDSGSPLIKDIYDEDLKKSRYVTLAVYNMAVMDLQHAIEGRDSYYSTNIKDKCRIMISKLNDDVLKWLGLVMDYERECDAAPQACENDIDASWDPRYDGVREVRFTKFK